MSYYYYYSLPSSSADATMRVHIGPFNLIYHLTNAVSQKIGCTRVIGSSHQLVNSHSHAKQIPIAVLLPDFPGCNTTKQKMHIMVYMRPSCTALTSAKIEVDAMLCIGSNRTTVFFKKKIYGALQTYLVPRPPLPSAKAGDHYQQEGPLNKSRHH